MRSMVVLLVCALALCVPVSPAFATSPASSPLLWLRADAGVTADSSNKVSGWTDQSGNGHNGTMATYSRQPTLVPGALGGQPVLRFYGAQSLYLTSPVSPTSFTVFVVGKNSDPSESFNMILGPGGNYANNQLRWENGSQSLFVGGGGGVVVGSNIGNTRVYHTLSARYNGSTLQVYRDGSQMSSHSVSTGAWTLAQVGGWYSSYFLIGDIAEVLIYSRALTETERKNTSAYLSEKYGLPCSNCTVVLCGNALCEAGESCASCPYDCGSCFSCNYNGLCEWNETSTCSDCCNVYAPSAGDASAPLAFNPCQLEPIP